ncbi:FAD-dependent thymidylate synthase [Candidatus Albibeggiatoa sp. nov. NOAA]|uniref:FAD-dependent thymidylate synthase n=1 Tax=Candidatus Albibeggiatoa sp. nov. NOAA TaxID=3162724 RepID=UPI003304C4AF|nr:FAD-dependent thymidylate synthase [Thiotrichaceae bacterium]
MTKTELPINIPLLDKGYVELQDFMGDDLSIVNAARVSFLGESKGDIKDKKLLNYLLRHAHTSPFEMVEFKLRVKCPLFVARQWMRHRVWSYNEVSRRYTSEELDFYIPETWRLQSTDNKQCSSGDAEQQMQAQFTQQMQQHVEQALDTYNKMIDAGIAREQARMVLPQNMYTTFVGKVDGHNLMHFMKLRMDEHAQYEIRVYADAIYEHFFKAVLPWSAEAFEKYVLKKA